MKKNLTRIIEESFLQKTGQALSTAGLGLAGAGVGAALGYDVDPDAIQYDQDTGEYLYSPESIQNIAAGAALGTGVGALAGYKGTQNSSAAQALGMGVLGAGMGIAGLIDAQNIPGMEDQIGLNPEVIQQYAQQIPDYANQTAENVQNGVEDLFAPSPDQPIDYLQYQAQKGFDQLKNTVEPYIEK